MPTSQWHSTTGSCEVPQASRHVCLVIFLDDTIVLTQSKEELEAQIKQVVYLFNLLGFSSSPSTVDPVPGFLIDARNMEIWLTQKTQLLAQSGREIWARETLVLTVRELARLIGRMSATIPAVYGPPCGAGICRGQKNQALQSSRCDS